jgi:hypothetical protein
MLSDVVEATNGTGSWLNEEITLESCFNPFFLLHCGGTWGVNENSSKPVKLRCPRMRQNL